MSSHLVTFLGPCCDAVRLTAFSSVLNQSHVKLVKTQSRNRHLHSSLVDVHQGTKNKKNKKDLSFPRRHAECQRE